ncbi:hypothetical protein DRP77_07410 [Candidatus Poribacteria bacterium]|nr:MAG: hypothetical protein DRP77_07410 [Candidatus Poribacteria bacterium]
MKEEPIYVCDADALINLYQHFPNKFRALRDMVARNKVKIPEGVYRELRRKTDRLRRYVERWERDYQFVIRFKDRRLREELARIERKYGERIAVGKRAYNGFWSSRAGRRSADPQVVAVGKVRGGIVVSDDLAVRMVCMLEGVECIGWSEFARRIRLAEQLALFQNRKGG